MVRASRVEVGAAAHGTSKRDQADPTRKKRKRFGLTRSMVMLQACGQVSRCNVCAHNTKFQRKQLRDMLSLADLAGKSAGKAEAQTLKTEIAENYCNNYGTKIQPI